MRRYACGQLVERFQAMAPGYAVALLRDPGLAEDTYQEAFVDDHMAPPPALDRADHVG